MKFSVLLPTRNRLQFLRYAVETVLRQDYEDWELIISDNDSEEDICAYVGSLADPRVKYFRTESFLPVTENWNNALSHSSGDYVIMLGDDDGLVPGYFRTLDSLTAAFPDPDFIYTGAWLYTYPGVLPGLSSGSLQPYSYADFLTSADGPYWLSQVQALKGVREFTNFRVTYGYNMQFAVVSRQLIQALRKYGPFYQSPFPDYYAMNAMFLKARRILACPLPLAVIGVTSKSYGYYYANNKESAGSAFLNNMPDPRSAYKLRRVVLPGTLINTNWLFAAETLRSRFGHEYKLHINHTRYRLLQILSVYTHYYVDGDVPRKEFLDFRRRLRPFERLLFSEPLSLLFTLSKRLRGGTGIGIATAIRLRFRQIPVWEPQSIGGYTNLLDVFEHLGSH